MIICTFLDFRITEVMNVNYILCSTALLTNKQTQNTITLKVPHKISNINHFNASCSKLLLFKGFSAILV